MIELESDREPSILHQLLLGPEESTDSRCGLFERYIPIRETSRHTLNKLSQTPLPPGLHLDRTTNEDQYIDVR